jgi:hypothetical protein
MSLFNFDPDTFPRGPFEQIEWNCNSRIHGVECADALLKMRRMKEREMSQPFMTIAFTPPARHYPVRAHGRRLL